MSKVRIKTVLGEAEIDPDTNVQVYIDGKVSFVKKAAELKPGDKVIFKKERINASIKDEDITLALEANPFYKHARSRIFWRYNSEQDKVTMLRKLILEGLINEGLIQDTEQFRKAIVMEDRDLTREEYGAARKGLVSLLKIEREPHETTEMRWLDNTTVLPREKYRRGLTVVNPELGDFSDEEGTRRRAYDFWLACRQQLGKRLRHGDINEQRQERDSEDKDKTPKTRVVVEDIINQIAEDYDENSRLAAVISTKVTSGIASKDSPIILNGAKKGETPLSLMQLMQDSSIIHSYAMPILDLYFIQRGLFSTDQRDTLKREILQQYFKTEGISGGYWAPGKRISPANLEKVMDELISDAPDESLKLPKGTVQRLLNLNARLYSEVPKIIREWEDNKVMSNSTNGSHLARQGYLKRERILRKRILERYGVNPDLIVSRFPTWTFICQRNPKLLSETDPNRLADGIEEIATLIKSSGKGILTNKEIEETLERYGLGEIITFNPWNLIGGGEDELKESAKRCFNKGKEVRDRRLKEYSPDAEWKKRAGEAHDKLVDKIIKYPELIEPGLELIKAEYRFEEGWARADLLYKDSKGDLLVVEVKPNAVRNCSCFNNGLKAVQQVGGYKGALERMLRYCPATRNEKINVRGILFSYQIDENTKEALKDEGFDYKEIPEEVLDGIK